MGMFGVEEEFYIVDVDGCFILGIDDLVYGLEFFELFVGWFDYELFQFIIEMQMLFIEDFDEVGVVVLMVCEVFVDYVVVYGYCIVVVGFYFVVKWCEFDYVIKFWYQV